MDNEFNNSQDKLPLSFIYTTTTNDQVCKVEQWIHLVKECGRGIITALPFKYMPNAMIIHFIHFMPWDDFKWWIYTVEFSIFYRNSNLPVRIIVVKDWTQTSQWNRENPLKFRVTETVQRNQGLKWKPIIDLP